MTGRGRNSLAGGVYFRQHPPAPAADRPMTPDDIADSSPHPPPPSRPDGAFTAVLLPLGAVAGVILLFALWTTDQLVIPGPADRPAAQAVEVFGLRVGSTESVPQAVWAGGFLLLAALLGGGLGLAAGKLLDRLSRWGT